MTLTIVRLITSNSFETMAVSGSGRTYSAAQVGPPVLHHLDLGLLDVDDVLCEFGHAVGPSSRTSSLISMAPSWWFAGTLALAADLQRRARVPIEDYAPSSLLVVAGALAFVGGRLATELAAPALVHWVHGLGALLVLLGLLRTARSASPDRRLDGVIRDPRRVRRSEEWMRPIDDRILEACDASGFVLTPAVIAYNIEYSREEVNRRLGELERRSFVERVERGKYRITERGRRYLVGPL
jgi:predicted transcriptional regulator